MLDRLSVGAKLSLAFFCVLLITALLGVLALFQLGRVNDTASDMASNWLPSSRAAQSINQEVTRLRTREYRLLLTEGNARVALGAGSGISNNFEMARPIFGREVNVNLRYKF